MPLLATALACALAFGCASARAATSSTTPPTHSGTSSKSTTTKPSTTKSGTSTKSTTTKSGTTKPKATTTHAATAVTPMTSKEAAAMAFEIRGYEDAGAYSLAAEKLRMMRPRVKPDIDLDVALALDAARAGQIDSAATLLWSKRFTAALADTMPLKRRGAYTWNRHQDWLDGAYTGWTWYILRARAEVAAAQGKWQDALVAARAAAAAHPGSGRDLYVLALIAGRAGQNDEAARAAFDAAAWDPILPEARYLAGLWEWKQGRRNAAQQHFRAAIDLDSSYRAPAIALLKARLPSSQPDTLPATFFNGIREVAMLTSPRLPKYEEFVQVDTPPALLQQGDIEIPDSLVATWNAVDLTLPVLVDTQGKIALFELPWFEPSTLPQSILSRVLAALPGWRYKPAIRLAAPIAVWTPVQLKFKP